MSKLKYYLYRLPLCIIFLGMFGASQQACLRRKSYLSSVEVVDNDKFVHRFHLVGQADDQGKILWERCAIGPNNTNSTANCEIDTKKTKSMPFKKFRAALQQLIQDDLGPIDSVAVIEAIEKNVFCTSDCKPEVYKVYNREFQWLRAAFDGTKGGTSGHNPRPFPGNPDDDPSRPKALERTVHVKDHGFLKVNGNRIVDQSDEVIQLRGMSLYWPDFGGDKYFNSGVVKTMKVEWRSNLIRALFHGTVPDDKSDISNDQYERRKRLVMAVTDAAIAEDMYVIIDFHDHHVNAGNHRDVAKRFFREMSQRYKNAPNVIFELWNEPIQIDWAYIKGYAEEVTSIIRANGAKQLVLIGTPNWSQDVDIAAGNPVSDPNTGYVFHAYTSDHNSLMPKVQAALDKGKAVFVTEWGFTAADGRSRTDPKHAEDVWMPFFDRNKLSWANWALCDKGEGSSALVEGAPPEGHWGDNGLTDSGRWIRGRLWHYYGTPKGLYGKK